MTKDAELHKLAWKRLLDGTELYYKGQNGEKTLRGCKESGGIRCSHCNVVVSASMFENHAEFGRRKKPYNYIYIESRRISLHEWSTSFCRDSSNDLNNSDESVISNRKGQIDGFQADEGSGDDIEREVEDFSSIVQADEGYTACVLCWSTDFLHPPELGPSTIMLCDQCDREYHVGCLPNFSIQDLKKNLGSDWFCSSQCWEIHESLKNQHNREPSSLEELVDVLKMGPQCSFGSIKCKVINGALNTDGARAWVLEAVDVLQESFDRLKDPQGQRDLIPLLVNGSGEEYRGMHCIVLLVNSKVVSAAVFRVFSTEVAELPLVATNKHRRKQGYFKTMFAFLEQLLFDLKVEKIVLPATKEAEFLWKIGFGFNEMEAGEVSHCLKSYPSIVRFGDTKMLWKRIPKYTSK